MSEESEDELTKMIYHYPIDDTWSKLEIKDVVAFFNAVEQAYEHKVQRQEVLSAYKRFKEIVPSKSEEKHYFNAFERGSGYTCYKVVKQAREADTAFISMK